MDSLSMKTQTVDRADAHHNDVLPVTSESYMKQEVEKRAPKRSYCLQYDEIEESELHLELCVKEEPYSDSGTFIKEEQNAVPFQIDPGMMKIEMFIKEEDDVDNEYKCNDRQIQPSPSGSHFMQTNDQGTMREQGVITCDKVPGKTGLEFNCMKHDTPQNSCSDRKDTLQSPKKSQKMSCQSETTTRHVLLHICQVCGMGFSHNSLLSVHELSHNVTNNKKHVTCVTIPQSYTQTKSPATHKLNHTVNMKYRCKECGVHCEGLNFFRRHQQSHKAFRPFECRLCRQYFRLSSELEVHQRTNHPGQRIWRKY